MGGNKTCTPQNLTPGPASPKPGVGQPLSFCLKRNGSHGLPAHVHLARPMAFTRQCNTLKKRIAKRTLTVARTVETALQPGRSGAFRADQP